MSSYTDVPQANQKISVTQAPIRANFSYINTAMQVNHTFNGNAISGEASGSHQELAFPNQLTDITSLATGIASVQYAIGGNLYAWNGSKNVVSGISAINTSQALTTSATSVFTVPADCVGFVTVFNNANPGLCVTFNFTSNGGNLSVPNTTQSVFRSQAVPAGNLNFLLATTVSLGITATVKYIYWPI